MAFGAPVLLGVVEGVRFFFVGFQVKTHLFLFLGFSFFFRVEFSG